MQHSLINLHRGESSLGSKVYGKFYVCLVDIGRLSSTV